MLRSIGRHFGRWLAAARPIPRPSAVLRLEGLEDRTTPAGTYTWKPSAAVGGVLYWDTPEYWEKSADATNQWPGQAGTDDMAKFTQKPNTASQLSLIHLRGGTSTARKTVTIKSLKLEGEFAETVVIRPYTSLVVKDGEFNVQKGRLVVHTDGALSLDHITAASWTGGSMKSDVATQRGTMYLYNGTKLTLADSPLDLSSNLVVGESQPAPGQPNGTASPATLDMGHKAGADPAADPQKNMGGQLTLYNNLFIYVKPQGVLNFNQNGNSDTGGGIVMALTSPDSKIYDDGKIFRTVKDDNGKAVRVEPKTEGRGVNGGLTVGKECKIYFVNGYTQTDGTLDLGKASELRGDYTVSGGKFQVGDSGEVGNYTTTLTGDLTMTRGTFKFGDTAGSYGTLAVAGKVSLGSAEGVTVDTFFRGNGAANNVTDRIAATGVVTLNTPLLYYTLKGGPSTSGWVYNFVTADGGMAGAWKEPVLPGSDQLPAPVLVVEKTPDGKTYRVRVQ